MQKTEKQKLRGGDFDIIGGQDICKNSRETKTGVGVVGDRDSSSSSSSNRSSFLKILQAGDNFMLIQNSFTRRFKSFRRHRGCL